ncbi:hypothetical protein JOY44_05200 [Phormidium sp. CLA17]|nr:hypothetical protein [Leptolyngbya sp. Cla-17]
MKPLLIPPVLVWEYGFVSLLLATVLSRGIAAGYAALIPQKYSQLTVGSITWEVGSKNPDYLILLGFVVGFFAIYLGFRLFAESIRKHNGIAAESAHRQLLIYSMIPVCLWIGNIFLVSIPTLELVIVSTVLVILTIAFSAGLLAKNLWFEMGDRYLACVGSSLLIILLGLFNGIALCLAIGRLNLSWQLTIDTVIITASVITIALIIALLTIWLLKRTAADPLLLKLSRLLVIAQGFLPLCFFVLLPNPWTDGKTKFYGFPIAIALYVLIISLVVISWVDLVKRFQKITLSEQARISFSAVSPICLIALLLYIKAPIVGVSYLPADDYHWGEFILPFWLTQTFGFIPYQDYEPARGLVNYVLGLFANLFLDGTAASYMAISGKAILFLPFFAIAFFAISPSIGLMPTFLTLVLMPSPGGLFEIDLMVTAGLCILANTFLKQTPITWLLTWLAISIALILFAPGQGGLFVISTLPLVAFVSYQLIRSDRKALMRTAIVTAIIFCIIALLTPLDEMLLGAIRYGAEQSSLNSTAYGVEWFKSRGSQSFLTYPLWEFVRTAWIVGSVAIGLLIYRVLVEKKSIDTASFLAYSVPIFLITLLLIPRSVGRIDPGSMSRLGNTTAWVICLLLPIVLLIAFEQKRKPLILISVALLGGIVSSALQGLPSFELAVRQPVEAINVTGMNFVDGNRFGMPGLNKGIVEPDQLNRLLTLKPLLNGLIDSGETYLDLSNRGAQHYYLGYPLPIQSGSPYNLIHTNQQLRALKKLENNPPPVVLAYASSGYFDGGSAALRTHLLYRFAAENYVPFAIDQFILLVRPDRVDRLKKLNLYQSIGNELPANGLTETIREIQLRLLEKAFQVPFMDGLPSSWGRSLSSLQSQIRPVAKIDEKTPIALNSLKQTDRNHYKVTGTQPSLSLDLRALKLDGRDAGLLAFNFSCQSSKTPSALKVLWGSQTDGAPDPNISIQFKPRPGMQLVPLDAAPRWLLAKGISTIQVALDNPACTDFMLKDIALFQRSEVRENRP